MSIITLLTDFGLQDEYAGIMKGVILTVNPRAVCVDLTHQIDPQDIVQAAWLLDSAYRYFPPGSVHVTVVDPGVGSRRAIVALEHRSHIFLAPDNGVLTLLLDEVTAGSAVRVENPDYFLTPLSATFHGRDIFAPVAAHLSKGLPLRQLGPPADARHLVRLEMPRPRITPENDLVGVIATIDRFGNLITNISAAGLQGFCPPDQQAKLSIRVGQICIRGLSDHYGAVAAQQPLALIGSRGYLELAVNSGNAQQALKAAEGDPVRIILNP